MRQADFSYTLTFEPAAAGTRMRSGQVRPKGAFRLLGLVITWMGIRQEQRMCEPEEAPGSSSGSVSRIGCFACRQARGR